MSTAANYRTNKIFIYTASVAVIVIAAVFSSMISARNIFQPTTETRKIVGKLMASFPDRQYVIFKVQTESGIDLEVFEKDLSGLQKLKQKFSFLDDTEAFLMMNENSENLALIDYDKDGFQDIVMPTVDKNGNSRLNIFKYNAELQQFMPQLLEE